MASENILYSIEPFLPRAMNDSFQSVFIAASEGRFCTCTLDERLQCDRYLCLQNIEASCDRGIKVECYRLGDKM